MAVAYQEFTYTSRNINSPVNATTPSGTGVDDLLIAFCFATVGGSWSSPGDWTAGPTVSGGGIFYRVAGGSEPGTYAFGFSNPALANMRVVIVRFTGAHPTNPIPDTIEIASSTSSNQVVSGTTVTYANSMLFNFFGYVSSTGAVTPPSGTTTAFNDGTGVRKVGAYEFPSTGATGSRTWTNGTNGRLAALVPIRVAATDYTKSASDTATATDSPSKAVKKPGLADSTTATDAATRRAGKGLADSTTATDALTQKVVGKGQADTATTADALSKAIIKPGIADLVTVTDAITTIFVGKNAADSVTTSDAITRKAVGKGQADTANPTDASAKLVTKPASDSATASDARTVSQGWGRTADDSVAAEDNRIISHGIKVGDAETIIVVDNTNLAFMKHVSDNAMTSDQVTKIFEAVRDFGDSVTTTDAVTKLIGLSPDQASVVVSDAISILVYTLLNFSDTIEAQDTLTWAQGFNRSHSDLVTVLDDADLSAGYNLYFDDQLGSVVDSGGRRKIYVIGD